MWGPLVDKTSMMRSEWVHASQASWMGECRTLVGILEMTLDPSNAYW